MFVTPTEMAALPMYTLSKTKYLCRAHITPISPITKYMMLKAFYLWYMFAV